VDILLWFLLSLVLFYYAIKLFLRYGLPWLMRRMIKRQQDRFGGFGEPANKRKEGDVDISGKNAARKKDDKDFGEYVDFEDIKE